VDSSLHRSNSSPKDNYEDPLSEHETPALRRGFFMRPMSASGPACVKTGFISDDEVSHLIIAGFLIWLRQFSSVGRFSDHRFVVQIFFREVDANAARVMKTARSGYLHLFD